ncbi:protein of unknown function [Methylocaldum szegediense]|uniref:Uncharacterized protein n=1 Tax=Methylocaldum szegediense TaxID=73780 RepID=A0ABM9I4N7_9GAMM|nr:protein of unknown function [Methylocaldum szegediense]
MSCAHQRASGSPVEGIYQSFLYENSIQWGESGHAALTVGFNRRPSPPRLVTSGGRYEAFGVRGRRGLFFRHRVRRVRRADRRSLRRTGV